MRDFDEIVEEFGNGEPVTSAQFILGDGETEEHIGWFGGDSRNPSWDDYLNEAEENVRPYVVAIRDACIRQDLVGMTGEDAQEGHFRFNNGVEFSCSWRAWGDIMQAIVNKREGYMRYYMGGATPDGWAKLRKTANG